LETCLTRDTLSNDPEVGSGTEGVNVLVQRGRRTRGGFARAALLALAAQLGGTVEQSVAAYTPIDLYTLTAPFPEIAVSGYPQSCFGAQAAGGAGTPSGNGYAFVWSSSGVPTDLHPTALADFLVSAVNGTSGTQQVGYGTVSSAPYHYRALLWSGSAASAVDLAPTNLPGFTDSMAIGTSGTQQVGYGSGLTATIGNNPNAMLWSGTADSAVDLNPVGFRGSSAWGTNGRQQVGGGVPDPGNAGHALLWSGTADSAVDLNPTRLSGYGGASVFAISPDGRQEVGIGDFNVPGSQDQDNHAMLWTGTAESAVDLHPAQLGLDNSLAYATNGTQQVGYGYTLADIDHHHALVWSGTAASAVNLQAVLPSAFVSSTAYSIDPAGNIFGIATDSSGRSHAVEWVVPDPSAVELAPLLLAMMALPRARRA
jgi:hypothetical protein